MPKALCDLSVRCNNITPAIITQLCIYKWTSLPHHFYMYKKWTPILKQSGIAAMDTSHLAWMDTQLKWTLVLLSDYWFPYSSPLQTGSIGLVDTPRFWTVNKDRGPEVSLCIHVVHWPYRDDRSFASLGCVMHLRSRNKLITPDG